MVTPTVVEAKVRLVGESVTASEVPFPLTAAVWGLPEALSAMTRDDEREPELIGLNATPTVQVPPAGILVPVPGT